MNPSRKREEPVFIPRDWADVRGKSKKLQGRPRYALKSAVFSGMIVLRAQKCPGEMNRAGRLPVGRRISLPTAERGGLHMRAIILIPYDKENL